MGGFYKFANCVVIIIIWTFDAIRGCDFVVLC